MHFWCIAAIQIMIYIDALRQEDLVNHVDYTV